MAAIVSQVVTASSVSFGVDDKLMSVPPLSRLLDTGEAPEGMTSGPRTWRARMAVMSSWNEDSCSPILPHVNRASSDAVADVDVVVVVVVVMSLEQLRIKKRRN